MNEGKEIIIRFTEIPYTLKSFMLAIGIPEDFADEFKMKQDNTDIRAFVIDLFKSRYVEGTTTAEDLGFNEEWSGRLRAHCDDTGYSLLDAAEHLVTREPKYAVS